MFVLPFVVMAQAEDESRYLRGAVPVENGYVVFRQHYVCAGQSQEELRVALLNYVKEQVVKGPNAFPQARLTDTGDTTGYIVASVEETLYFRRSAWVTHFTRFLYQLVVTPSDGGFDIEMRHLRYLYDEGANPQNLLYNYTAEDLITDAEALNAKGQLKRLQGKKFRRFTLDRRDELFAGAARAVGNAVATR